MERGRKSFVGGAAGPASCSGLTPSALNFFAEASIFAIVSSNSGFAPFWKRIGLIRATTNGLRYGLSKPRSFRAAIAATTAASSSRSASARSFRTSRASASGLPRNVSMRLSKGWYAPPAKRPFCS